MECLFCEDVELLWKSNVDREDNEGNPLIENYYECPTCESFYTVTRKV